MTSRAETGDAGPRLRETRVILRPLGSPLPLGFAGLAVASFLLTGVDLGWVAETERHHVAAALLAGALPLQTTSFLFALPARDGASATATALLAAAWASVGVNYAMSAPGTTSGALGLALLALGALLILSAAVQAFGKPLAAVAYALAGTRFVLTGIHELTQGHGWQDASGAVGLAIVAVAAYAVVAFELEDALDRPLLPTFRRGRGRRALAAPAEDQLGGLDHEPGVRQQL
jgi:succinate-acetate transporter protein